MICKVLAVPSSYVVFYMIDLLNRLNDIRNLCPRFKDWFPRNSIITYPSYQLRFRDRYQIREALVAKGNKPKYGLIKLNY